MFKRTKMMDEAKMQGKKRSPSIELIMFMVVFILSGYVQFFALAGCFLFYFLNDNTFVALTTAKTIELNSVVQRASELLEIAPEWLTIAMVFASLLLLLAAVFYCRKFDKRNISTLGMRKANLGYELILGFSIGALGMALVAILGIAVGVFNFDGFGKISVPVFTAYLIAFAVQGISEEVLIRGYYLTAVSKTSGPVYSLISSCILYMLLNTVGLELDIFYIINTFLFSLVAGLLVIKRGNIWAASAFNFAWSFMQTTVLGFNITGESVVSTVFNISSVKGFASLNGDMSGPLGGMIVTLSLFLALGVALKMKQNENEISDISEVTDEKA